MDLSKPYRRDDSMTRLQKLIQSLKRHIYVGEEIGESFLKRLEEVIEKGFGIGHMNNINK